MRLIIEKGVSGKGLFAGEDLEGYLFPALTYNIHKSYGLKEHYPTGLINHSYQGNCVFKDKGKEAWVYGRVQDGEEILLDYSSIEGTWVEMVYYIRFRRFLKDQLLVFEKWPWFFGLFHHGEKIGTIIEI